MYFALDLIKSYTIKKNHSIVKKEKKDVLPEAPFYYFAGIAFTDMCGNALSITGLFLVAASVY